MQNLTTPTIAKVPTTTETKAVQTAVTGDGLNEVLPGLVWAYGFDDEGRAHVLDAAEVSAFSFAAAGWMWLHFNLADARARDWIESHAPLPAAAKELLLDTDDHLSLVAADDVLLGVLADFRREIDHDTHDIGRLKFALDRRLLVTGRRRSLSSVDEVRRSIMRGTPYDCGEVLLESIFDQFNAQVSMMIRELGDRVEVIEDRVVEDSVDPDDLRVGPVRRMALRLNRQVGALRLHFTAFVDNPERDLPDEVFAMTERVSLRLTSLVRDIEALQERARIVQEEVGAKATVHMNRQLSTLSLLTALFLPATLVTGLFGMNTHGLPFGASDNAFWYAAVVGALGSGAVYWVLKHMGVVK